MVGTHLLYRGYDLRAETGRTACPRRSPTAKGVTATAPVDKVDPAALAEATGALAVLAWQLANAESAPAPKPAAPAAPAP